LKNNSSHWKGSLYSKKKCNIKYKVKLFKSGNILMALGENIFGMFFSILQVGTLNEHNSYSERP